jgi:hypothetical protein
MKVTLRKANVLQNSINDAVKSISLKTEITVNEFQNPESEVAAANKKLMSDLVRRDQLTEVLYEIRKAVSSANHTAGVDTRLADIAHLEKQIQYYTALAGKEVRENMDVINGQLGKIRNRPADSRSIYGLSDSITSSVLEAEDVKTFKSLVIKAKKAKQKFQDEVLELNVRTEIQLSEKSVQILTQEGLE